VTEEEAKTWMEEAGVSIFFETSAKTAQNVRKMFEEVCNQLFLQSLSKAERTGTGNHDGRITLKVEEEDGSSFCC
jgi:AAA+ ATPase superfamily predicted ATPase